MSETKSEREFFFVFKSWQRTSTPKRMMEWGGGEIDNLMCKSTNLMVFYATSLPGGN
jgi:hypothetical protein